MKNSQTLTALETATLKVFQEGMDASNEGWLHEMDCDTPVQGCALSGVVSSLVKKEVITSDEHDGGMFWIEVKEAYQA